MDPIADDDRLFHPTDNKASIALLRRARAGERVSFVHRVDVCDAVPEVLVADLQPVPGTGLGDGGYSSVWYCYYAKKFTNKRGKLTGYRQRAVTGGGGTSWHSEISRKDVQGSDGGTFCTFSYGRKPNPSSNTIDRMGWCMVEYDLKQQDEAIAAAAGDASNYVLCKVYRSNRAKGKPASASASSSKKMGKKRKARGGDHPEAPPAKLIQQQQEPEPEQEQVQQESAAYCGYQLPQGGVESDHGGEEFFSDFNFNIEDIDFYVDDESILQGGAMPEPGLQQQPIAEPEPEEFTVEWLLRGQPQQQPIMEPPQPAGHGGEFIQMPCGPVVPAVPEATLEDMFGLGPDPVTASVPWSSYAPTSSPSSYTPSCSGLLLQGPSNPLQLPYLMF